MNDAESFLSWEDGKPWFHGIDWASAFYEESCLTSQGLTLRVQMPGPHGAQFVAVVRKAS